MGGGTIPNTKYLNYYLLHYTCVSFKLISILDSYISILLKEISALFNMPSYLNLILLCTFVKIFRKLLFTNLQMGVSCHYFNHQMLRQKVNLIALLTDPDLICVLLFCLYFNILDYIWRDR